jgi:hypothetical protein
LAEARDDYIKDIHKFKNECRDDLKASNNYNRQYSEKLETHGV